MKISQSNLIRSILLLSSFLAVAACGVTPVQSQQSASGTLVSNSRQSESFSAARLAGLSDDELEIRSDPNCGVAEARFEGVIVDVLDKFNEFVARSDEGVSGQIPLAGHPSAPEDGDDAGISALVCDDSILAAYAYNRTVVVNEGLLAMLWQAAWASALYSEDPEALDMALDDIAYYALTDSSDDLITNEDIDGLSKSGDFSRIAGDLFSSAVAFVIYHELGHSYMGHALSVADDGALEDSAHEIEADIFAASSMKRAGLPIDGADLVFSILGRINPEGSFGHPSSLKRASVVERVAHGGAGAGAPPAN
ncbi:hypothetical protein MNBD_NITROSPINAE04-1635 [hydrothermal vent metagenome]|uniref:Uncharacterized protein n=1 Tax=hydrothermal vent metagenome TaxID=652676 RepID=A0A3B1CN65_9ZZZZ